MNENIENKVNTQYFELHFNQIILVINGNLCRVQAVENSSLKSSSTMNYQIAGRQKQSAVADYLMPTNGLRGAQVRAGKTPKNHMKDNLMALKYAQAAAREERENAARQTKDLYKLEQFRNVPARVYDEPPLSPRRSARGEENVENREGFLQKGASERRLEDMKEKNRVARIIIQEKIEDARFIADRPTTPRKDPTPKHNEVSVFKPRTQDNWIAKNKDAAEKMQARATFSTSEKSKQNAAVHESFGQVPKYLQQRKQEWENEKEEAARRAPDPNCPKGMKLMAEDERLQTLEVLKTSRDEAMNQLARMPFILETPTAKRKHSELELKLKEIDAALMLFSKQKVYIADNR